MLKKSFKKIYNKKSNKFFFNLKNSTKLRRIALRAFIFWHFHLNFRKVPRGFEHCGLAVRVVPLDAPRVRVIISIVYRNNLTKIVSFMVHFKSSSSSHIINFISFHHIFCWSHTNHCLLSRIIINSTFKLWDKLKQPQNVMFHQKIKQFKQPANKT